MPRSLAQGREWQEDVHARLGSGGSSKARDEDARRPGNASPAF